MGGAWLLTKENFLKDVKWLNMLKLKASYGIQGNDDLLDPSGYSNYYPYQDQYSVGRVDGDFSLTLNYKGNKNITWESSHSLNVGVEFGLWDDRLSGSVEYFSRKTSDMLYYKPVPPSLGYSRQPINVGSMRNAGVEIQLSAGLLRYKNFSWDLDLNMTHYKNKILSLDGDEPAAVVRRYDDTDLTTLAVKAAADLGPLFLDGLADGIRILDDRFTEAQLRDVELMILQAARVRFSHTEYIACPSCGRTLYDIEQTLAAIKARTSHLKNLRIGVMGCIVNGPGEMADADYGYVGAAPGRITLYKGRTVVARNIPQEEALDRLVALIRENGDWREPGE